MKLSKEELDEHFFLDVREESEFEEKSIDGSFNLPYRKVCAIELASSIGFWESKIPKNKIIVIYCATGKRAKLAEKSLLKKGYQVINLLTFEHAEDYALAIREKEHGK